MRSSILECVCFARTAFSDFCCTVGADLLTAVAGRLSGAASFSVSFGVLVAICTAISTVSFRIFAVHTHNLPKSALRLSDACGDPMLFIG